MMTPWQKLFEEARNTSAWKGIFPARREKILYTRDEKVSGDKWIIRDLWIDLQQDVGERLNIANPKPKTVSIFADVVYVPANLSMTLKNMGLIIVARRIEVEEQATVRLDYSSSKGATIMLFTAEIGGKLQAEAVMPNPEIIPITVPQQAGLWIKYDFTAEKAKAREVAKLENKLFERGSPLWLMAVSAFQMATVLVVRPVNIERTPEQALELNGKASQMLDFILRCAKDAVPEKTESAADWQDLAAESKALKTTLETGTSPDTGIEYACLYARLLNRDTQVDERQRRLKEVRRASGLRNQAPSYELVETKMSPPKPEDCKYIRHGAQTLGIKKLNGWNQPVRQVTLSGVEIELDELDRSGFIKTYSSQKDIQALYIHADTLVIKTRLHFPQTNVFVYCRELYFEGDDACIDTQPVATEYRASLDKDGADGAKAGDISLYIQRFGTTEKEEKKYDLKLMSVEATGHLVNEGCNLVVVALVKADQDTEYDLHIRIFNGSGKKVVDKGENELAGGKTLSALKERLNPIPDASALTTKDKQKLIAEATLIAGYTQAGKHFRAVGGKGQDPDEGEILLSYTQKHLPLITEKEWGDLFKYTNRKVGGAMVDEPAWDKYKEYHPAPEEIKTGSASSTVKTTGIVYSELKIDGRIIDSKGVKESPGTGGKGPTPGRPGTGGAGGILSSTLEEVLAYADLSGGSSGFRITSTKGGAGGTPDVAYWFLFKNETVSGKLEFVPEIIKNEAQTGPNGDSGPEPYEPKGKDGNLKIVTDAPPRPWLTAINLRSAVQFAKDALASGNTGLAREFLMPYLDGLNKRPPEKKDDAILQLESEASALAEQAIQNVDYFGNPPGWVPMLALESAVTIYKNVLNSSMQEIFTSYYLQKAWQAKISRQEALQSLVGLLTKNTEATKQTLITTRTDVITTIQSLKQLTVEIETLVSDLKEIETRLRNQADYLTNEKEKLQIISAAFKIFGAVAKAIPLPEPYQMAAGALGTVFDITSEFVKEGGATDAAFGKLKSGVNDFLETNSDNFIDQSNKGLDESLLYVKSDIKELQDKADAASKEKDKLEASYEDKRKEHADLIKKEKEVLDTTRERLLYGRGSRKKEMVTWLEKDFKEFEEKQKAKLKNDTKDYAAQQAKVDDLEEEIKSKEKEAGKAKEAVEKKKKDNAKLIKTGIEKVQNITAGVETIGKTVNELMMSRTQLNSLWDKELAKLKIEDKDFQDVSNRLTLLNQRKTALATELLALKTSLSKQSNQISNNLLTVNVLSSQMGSSKDALDPTAIAYAQSIGQEAHQSLMQFLYYVVKAYEYYMVEPWGKLDHGAQKLFEDLQNILEPSDHISGIDNDLTGDQKQKLQKLLSEPVSFKENMLTTDEFQLLTIVYEKPLRDMGKRLANQLASGAGSLLKEAPKTVTLAKEQLKELNGLIKDSELDNTIPFSLVQLRQIDQSNEKQRIGNIKVVKVQCKKLGKAFPDSITFKISHRGKSVVRAQGKLFAFEPEGGREEERGQRSRVIFKTLGGKTDSQDWSINEEIGILEGNTLWQPTSDIQENLLNQFLKTDKDEPITLSEFRPGVFSDFDLSVEISPPEHKIELEEIRLQVTTEAGNAQKQTLICVSTQPELAIPITASLKDMSDRSGGLGSYIGIFKLEGKTVQLSVPERYGNYVHTGWCIDGEEKGNNGQHHYEVRKSSYLVANYKLE